MQLIFGFIFISEISIEYLTILNKSKIIAEKVVKLLYLLSIHLHLDYNKFMFLFIVSNKIQNNFYDIRF